MLAPPVAANRSMRRPACATAVLDGRVPSSPGPDAGEAGAASAKILLRRSGLAGHSLCAAGWCRSGPANGDAAAAGPGLGFRTARWRAVGGQGRCRWPAARADRPAPARRPLRRIGEGQRGRRARGRRGCARRAPLLGNGRVGASWPTVQRLRGRPAWVSMLCSAGRLAVADIVVVRKQTGGGRLARLLGQSAA